MCFFFASYPVLTRKLKLPVWRYVINAIWWLSQPAWSRVLEDEGRRSVMGGLIVPRRRSRAAGGAAPAAPGRARRGLGAAPASQVSAARSPLLGLCLARYPRNSTAEFRYFFLKGLKNIFL